MKYTLCNGAYADVQILLKVKGNFIFRVQCLEFWRVFWGGKKKWMYHICIHSFCNNPKICIHFKLLNVWKNPTHWTYLMGIRLFRDFCLRAIIVCVRLRIGGLSWQVKRAQFGIWTAAPIPPTPWSRVHQPVSQCSIKSFIVSNKSLYFDMRSRGRWPEWFHVCLKPLSC